MQKLTKEESLILSAKPCEAKDNTSIKWPTVDEWTLPKKHTMFKEKKIKRLDHIRKMPKPRKRNKSLTGRTKNLILMRANYQCEKCGRHEKKSSMSITKRDKNHLHIHHINWDDTDNDASNLAVLCTKCHGKIHSYMIKNVGRYLFYLWMDGKTVRQVEREGV